MDDGARQIRPSREELEAQIQKLQDRGVIDLDAPLRDAIPALARNLVRSAQADAWWVIASGDDPHAVCECEF
jgi:hypothetical protein